MAVTGMHTWGKELGSGHRMPGQEVSEWMKVGVGSRAGEQYAQ
jgi:hypothetical protein